MSVEFSTPLRLLPKIQHYAWGKTGANSSIVHFVPKYLHEEPCAELWFGDHPHGPSLVSLDAKTTSLPELIAAGPKEVLGTVVSEQFGGRLPFLLKLLSVRTALSIQTHPDARLAAELHRTDPEHYPDNRHKPEMAIALSPVCLLHGFRSREEIGSQIFMVPPLRNLIEEQIGAGFASYSIREIYRAVMTAPSETIERVSQALFKWIRFFSPSSPEVEWIRRLEPEYPTGDVGLFCFFLFNLEQLQPGDAIFIGPNEPHAYLEGEMIECMAASDNVVRGGLTTKYKDVPTLLSMIDYQTAKATRVIPTTSLGVTSYVPPATEFAIDVVSGEGAEFVSDDRPEIVLVLEGSGQFAVGGASTEVKAGEAFLVSASISNYAISGNGAKFVRAYVPG